MNQEIYEKLREMRLPIMAEEYKDQSENTDTQNMTFEERLEAMVIKEYDSQINHTVKRYIKKRQLL
ncbi:ATP-binding protein [Holdemanella porci]|uniref:ATP-binding protein n=1 Tax=Holdemanella porci TaxID=2652276 RepID=UPI002FDE0B2D